MSDIPGATARPRWPLVPAAMLVLATGLAAQAPVDREASPECYAQVRVLEGSAAIRKAELDEALSPGVPVAEGDWIDSRGRGILQLADGTRIAFDGDTRFQVADLFADPRGAGEVLLKLDYGRLRVHVGGRGSARVRVDTASGSGTLQGRADADFAVVPDGSLEHWVYAGSSTFANRQALAVVPAGQRLTVADDQDGLDRLVDFNTYDQDGFDAWCGPRLNPPRGESTTRVPREIRAYADTLDGLGEWLYVPGAGAWCWRPGGLGADWRPYWNGRWGCYPDGLTWVSAEPWGYLTYHYGRWGWDAGLGWYWIPGAAYSPAWVAWETGDDDLGWAPLGQDDRPCGWDFGPWRGGYCWNIVNVQDLSSGNLRSRVLGGPTVLAVFNRGAGAVPWFRGRMLVTPAEFRSPALVLRVAAQPGLLRARAAAYGRALAERPLGPAAGGVGRTFGPGRPPVTQTPVRRESGVPSGAAHPVRGLSPASQSPGAGPRGAEPEGRPTRAEGRPPSPAKAGPRPQAPPARRWEQPKG